ncbi:DUF6574 domain-containing protein [Pontibacillus salipaludis]|uniref:DUF6574 domain-containing protein n=1 Tax=Pontibacillus salipaludis TaxID=1697394 RepID=UPI0031E9CA63
MICTNCNHEQESGKFCGNCGFELSAGDAPSTPVNQPVPTPAPATTTAAQAAPPPPNENVERAKAFSRGYFQEVMRYVKQPNQAFSASESQFGHGLLTIGLYLVLFALTIYIAINNYYKSSVGGFFEDSSIPFFNTVVPLAGNLFLVIAGSALSMFVIQLIIQNGQKFKTFTARYGSLLTPFMMLNALSMILAIVGMIEFALILLVLSITIVINFLPPLAIYHYSQASSKSNQSIYWALVAAGASSLISAVIIATRLIMFIEEFLEMFSLY